MKQLLPNFKFASIKTFNEETAKQGIQKGAFGITGTFEQNGKTRYCAAQFNEDLLETKTVSELCEMLQDAVMPEIG